MRPLLWEQINSFDLMPSAFQSSSGATSSLFFGVTILSVIKGHNMMNRIQIGKLLPFKRRYLTEFIITRFVLVFLLGLQSHLTFSQGEDSGSWERDLMVLATLFDGHYANSNQTYFDKRMKQVPAHESHTLLIRRSSEDYKFSATLTKSESDKQHDVISLALSFASDESARAVRTDVILPDGQKACSLFWQREAAQFRARPNSDCKQNLQAPAEIVISKKQLWWTLSKADAPELIFHRSREFGCYADLPGVGGGRDEPHNRFDNLRVHDQGGEAWFTSKEGRRLGIRLFLVDWPINNYQGFFARDSLVIYVMERTGSGTEEHGYSFTVPSADRIGINLKWMLANCSLVSGRDATPSF